MLPVYKWPAKEARQKVARQFLEDDCLAEQVQEIVETVRDEGDQALLRYSELFDGCLLEKKELKVSVAELEGAYQAVTTDFEKYLRQAKKKISDFHQLQKPRDWFRQEENGSLVGQIYRPLARVGIYVPGGTASYPSTVLMTALLAKMAGVKEIVMVTPPDKTGQIAPAILVAAQEAGVTEIYRVGGAQAIAALAYGTESIAPVDKIVGPGNIYVTLAKKMVYGVVGLDFLAGPSEVLIIGDGSVPAEYGAADLLAQAEHDLRARALLVTANEAWALQVKACLVAQLGQLPRREIAEAALRDFGAIIITQNLAEAFQVANCMAPEHLELLLVEPLTYLPQVKHAGAIFLGPATPEAVGDYWAGPSHVLPTGGTARYASPLTVADFYKCSSLLNYSVEGLREAREPVCYLAQTEGLVAHGQAIMIREKEGEK